MAHVLVVDDNEANRDMLSRRLAKAGHDATPVDSGQAALDRIEADTSLELVLLDIMMPEMDGIEVLRRIREKHSDAELPIIMVTAKGGSEQIVEALDLGANDYVTKPIDFPVVLARIHRHLSVAHEASEQAADDGASLLDNPSPQRLRDLIAQGEGDALEFKSTLRWNIKAGRAGKEIEVASLKTIVAYLNTDGGTLLVGVQDDGQILGLEQDGFANDDKLLLHVNNLIREHIGLEFAREIRFGLVAGDDEGLTKVLVIECEKTGRPAFLKAGKDEDFYVRIGPGSRKLTTSEALKYIKGQA